MVIASLAISTSNHYISGVFHVMHPVQRYKELNLHTAVEKPLQRNPLEAAPTQHYPYARADLFI